MRTGKSTSCGSCSRFGADGTNFKHGKSGTVLHNIWLGMKDRCNNPNNENYHRYGGRGIKVCELWQKSFVDFEAHMGARPSPAHSLDRVDNSRGYEPGNVRWATPERQSRNRDVTLYDDGMSLADIADETGVNYFTLHNRYERGDRGARLRRPARFMRRPA